MTTAEDKELRNKTKRFRLHATAHERTTSDDSDRHHLRPINSVLRQTDRQTDRHDAVSRAASEMQPYSQQIASLAKLLMSFSRLRSSAGH